MSACCVVRRMVVAGLASLGVLLVCGAGSAIAFTGYADTPSIEFGASGSGEGQFTHPTGVAIDEASGDVYVVDQGDNRVERFTAKGQYLSQFNGSDNPAFPEGLSLAGAVGQQIAVDNASSGPSKGDVYVVDSGHNVVDKFTAEGKFVYEIGGFTEPVIGIAVGQGGQLWTLEGIEEEPFTPRVVKEFNGAEDNQFVKTSQPLLISKEYGAVGRAYPGLTVDSKGNLYFIGVPWGQFPIIEKWNPTTEVVTETQVGASYGNSLTFDPATNNLFLDSSNGVQEVGSVAEPNESSLENFGATIQGSVGIAVGPNSTVYASSADTVDIFDYGQLPSPSTGSASGLLRGSAKLEGTVNPEGSEVTSCKFEYGTTTALGQVAECSAAMPGSGSSPVAESAQLSGLELETTYYYRITAGDSLGVVYGDVNSFTTTGPVPELETGETTGVELAGESIVATLHGSLAPDGVDTHYYFEYGETSAYGSATPTEDAGTAFQLERVHAQIGGLEAFKVYHYRLVATNALGTRYGADAVFPTNGLIHAPIVTGLPATGVTQFTATLNGSLKTFESNVDYYFQYGTSTAYGQVQPIPDGVTPLTTEAVPVTQPITGLQAGTTYHYRLLASSPGATDVAGPDETFTTLSAPAPEAVTGASSEVGVGSAVVVGTVDPHGENTSYLFEYGTSTAYGSSWPTVLVDMGALEGSQPVIVTIPNLLPKTTYHYRLTASNAGGTSYGQDMTFTTGEYAAQVIQEPPSLGTLFVPVGGKIPVATGKSEKTKKAKKGKKVKKGKKGKTDRGGGKKR
jgi:hypothetical protein